MDITNTSILHLIYLGNSIENYFKILKKLDSNNTEYFTLKEQEIILASLSSQILLLTDSFIFEYEKQFIKTDNNEDLIRIFKPLIDRIKKWDGLNAYRNHVLAHNLRIKNENYISVFEKGVFNKFNVPKNAIELSILVKCVKFISDFLFLNYESEFENLREEVLLKNLSEQKSQMTQEEADKDFQTVFTEFDRLCGIEKALLLPPANASL